MAALLEVLLWEVSLEALQVQVPLEAVLAQGVEDSLVEVALEVLSEEHQEPPVPAPSEAVLHLEASLAELARAPSAVHPLVGDSSVQAAPALHLEVPHLEVCSEEVDPLVRAPLVV